MLVNEQFQTHNLCGEMTPIQCPHHPHILFIPLLTAPHIWEATHMCDPVDEVESEVDLQNLVSLPHPLANTLGRVTKMSIAIMESVFLKL